MTIARDLGYDTRVDYLTRSDLYICDEMFVCGTAAEVSAVNSVDDREIPCPGREDPGRSRPSTRRPSAARPTDTRTGVSMSTNDNPTDRPTPLPNESRSTTRPCATARSSRASRSPSTTSCGSPSSSTGSASTTSRPAGRARTRRTTSSSSARQTELQLETSKLVAFGMTRRVKGKVDSDDTLRHLVEANTGDGLHRRQVLGLPRARGARHDARRGRRDGRRLDRRT